ncbi:hypothetical protein M3J09_002081 [Ascochyta lentis]
MGSSQPLPSGASIWGIHKLCQGVETNLYINSLASSLPVRSLAFYRGFGRAHVLPYLGQPCHYSLNMRAH